MLFRLVLGKEKFYPLVTSLELYLVFDQFTQYMGQKNPTYFYCELWLEVECRLPSLAKVLLCLVRVGVPQVSWTVRYLDKL